MAETPAGSAPVVSEREASRVALASFAGTALEWYDYFLFGTAASIVFNRLYFVSDNEVAATLAAFASFAIGFVARPVGALIFGHFGDRIGRRRILIITVAMISAGTGVIGLLPDFNAIGVAAPILLTCLRILQGLSVGGEWGGAMTLAVEHAPPNRRGRYAALPQVGSPVGTLLSSGAFAAVQLFPSDTFDAWGWRLPFLVAFPLLVVAVYLRRRVEESPLFEQVLQQHDQAKVPAVEVFRSAGRAVIASMAISLIGVGGFYLMTTFVISYGVNNLDLSPSLMLIATLVGASVEIVVLLAFGRIADRITPARVCVLGGVLSAIVAFPVFWTIDTQNPAAVILAVTAGIACLSIPYAVYGPLIGEMFPPKLRYSGVSIGYNLGGVISGFVPLIATAWLAASGGQAWAPATLLAILALLSAAGGAWGGQMRQHDEVHTKG